MEKVCDICGEKFETTGNGKRCSEKCRRKGELNAQKIYNKQRSNRVEDRYFRKIVNNISTHMISHIIKDEIGCMNGCKNIPHYALDYHHVGERYYSISGMITSGVMDTFLDEVLKCKVLCANCHRGEHYGDRRIGIY